MAKKKKKMPGLNTSSTADISFMLLIFFLVTTSMDTDMGLARRLPQPPDKEQEQAQMEAQMKEAEMQLKDTMNQRDNETKILIAGMSSQSQEDGIQEQEFSEESRANLLEKMREFDERLKLDRERLAFDKSKARTDAELKKKQINKPTPSAKK